MNKTITTLLAMSVAFATLGQYAGSPDIEFGEQGHTSQNIATGDQSTAIALQSEGKILVTSVSSDLISSLSRFNPDGTVDTSFGTNGVMTITVSNAAFFSANSVCVTADDKIVIGFTMGDNNFFSYYGCMRLLPDGTPDNTFGTDGIAITAVDPTAFYGGMYGLVLQPDGQIISYGVTSDPTDANVLMFRLTADGTFDDSFGTNGYSEISFTPHGDYPMRIKFTQDNKMLIAGYAEIPSGSMLDPAYNDIGIARTDINGHLDLTFGINGVFTANLSDMGDMLKDVLVLSDGSIYAAGNIDDGNDDSSDGITDFLLCKLTFEGNFDTSFDEDGWKRIDVQASNDALTDLLYADGKLLLTGSYTFAVGGTGFILMSRNLDGTPDATFGQSFGYVTDSPGGPYSTMTHSILQPDGKILVAGNGNMNGGVDILLARYLFLPPVLSMEEMHHNIQVYPNPASVYLMLPSDISGTNNIFIFDQTGRKMETPLTNNNQRIDIHHLAPGIYTLQSGNHSARFVKVE